MTDDEIQLKNRELIVRIKEKSEDDFEKNLVLITSGTLVLSMTFIDKIVPIRDAKGVIALVIAWSFLAFSLLVNLISHQLSSKYSRKYVDDMDSGKDYSAINREMSMDNKRLARMNNLSVGFMISGIISLVVYCSINVFRMSNLGGEKNGDRLEKPYDPDINKGRTSTPLQIPKPVPQPSTQSPQPTQPIPEKR